ncbi:response regulator transcription factor [Imperialibacter roseus]|uniref:Response regulator transcription factor n=1 Tax=Imperialibacter roseus TaxID=1324217 RepID=A0ABZ0IWV6_9BACT|nr:response regulator transcription factor [Imperialibacter roseus]WOK09271.1 response regulator transcription factor [Imperialibacter roseus]|tara:strand:+ start:1700 stop:2074 length:375 start_codon:yes stop_codon:yes gene_type:complete
MDKVRILICEDNEAISTLTKFKLARVGYTHCDIAANGRIASELVVTTNYDLVITDIQMPFVSGLELTRYIRNDLGRRTPVIILSSNTDENTVLTGFDREITVFLAKPVIPRELVQRVKKLLKRK